MKLTQIREGKTDLMVPKDAILHLKGPSTSRMAVFFNPVMELSRDVSVLMLREFLKKRKTRLLDGLAGTGARGVRIGNECKGDFHVVINDHNPVAAELIERNIALNALENCQAENRKLNTLLSDEDFDYVDIDPFGSPVGFIDAAVQSLRADGMLALTATDKAPLYGTYPKTCLRRYDARPLRTPYSHEIGTRILVGHCIKLAAKYDMALTPIHVFSVDHYLRAHFNVKKGAKRADKALENVGYILHNHKTGERKAIRGIPEHLGEGQVSGPLWLGNLHEKVFLAKIRRDKCMGTVKRLEKLLDLWLEEADSPPLFYDVNEIASLTKTHALPIRSIIGKLKENGFAASRTHFSPTGFKTDAKISDIKALVCSH